MQVDQILFLVFLLLNSINSRAGRKSAERAPDFRTAPRKEVAEATGAEHNNIEMDMMGHSAPKQATT